MAKIPITFDALKEAIIREQVMKTYRKEMVIFLAEREYETLDQLAQAADRFEEAHSQVGAPERKDRPHTSERPKTNGWRANNNGRMAWTSRTLLMPREPPVGTSVMHPHGRLCVTPAMNRYTYHVTAGTGPNR